LLLLDDKLKMPLPTNQRKKIEEKLRLYDEPFITYNFLRKLLDTFAPNYQIKTLTTCKLISPIIRKNLYFNHLAHKKHILATTILSQYGQGKLYAVGGAYLYNQYHFSQQVPNYCI
jgi:hypothetical protein